MTPGQRLRQARERAGLSQTQLGNLLGVTQGSVYQWEHDRTRPKGATFGKLARFLDVDLRELAAWFDEAAPKIRVEEAAPSEYAAALHQPTLRQPGGTLRQLQPDQRELLLLYTQLSKARQEALLDFLKRW